MTNTNRKGLRVLSFLSCKFVIHLEEKNLGKFPVLFLPVETLCTWISCVSYKLFPVAYIFLLCLLGTYTRIGL